MSKKFQLSFFIFTLLLVVLPLNLKAENASASTEAELTTAVANTSVDAINIEGDFTVTSPKTIARDITIKSNPPEGSTVTEYTLDGGDSSSFFNITSPSSTIKDLNLTNGAATVSGQAANGGAINIAVTTTPATATAISSITVSNVTFDGNNAAISAAGNVSSAGGAIYTDSKQSVIISSSTFKSNTATAASTDGGTAISLGGAIYHKGDGALVISNSSFDENKATDGGAIYSEGKGLKITSSTFTKNEAAAEGGALNINEEFEGSSLTFTQNKAGANGGAVKLFSSDASFSNSSFTGNTSTLDGGAMYNAGIVSLSKVNFNNNEASGEGGAVYNTGDITALSSFNLIENTALNGGAIYNTGSITAVSMNFTDNTATGDGGALYTTNASGNGNIVLSGGGSFTGNTAGGLGGAIYQDGTTLTLMSVAGINFSGNTDSNGANAIYMTNSAILNLNAINSPINFRDPIRGDSSNEININGTHVLNPNIPNEALDAGGTVNFYTDMPDYLGAINTYGGTLGIFTDITFNTSAFTAQNTTFNLMNNSINSLTIASDYTQTGSGALKLDMDLKNQTTDTIEATGTLSGASLNVSDVRIISDSSAASTIAMTVSNTFDITFDTSKIYYGPIFEYTLSQPDTHSVVADKTNNFTPPVLSASIAQNSAMLNNITASNSLLNRVGVMLSKDGRYYNTKNSYSLSKYDKFVNNRPFATSEITQGNYYTTWFVPYGSFQDFNFEDNMSKVENNAYGASAGVDMPVIGISDNVGFIPTVFAGYGNATQKYRGLTSKRDSFSGGVMGTLYGPYFYASLEAHASDGTQVSEFATYRDSFDVFTATSAAKVEVSIPLFWQMTLQPNITAAYNFVNSQSYTTGLGAPITAGNYTNVQVMPGVKLAADIKSWHPYASYAYSHNAYNDAKIQIENFTLPEFMPKDYSEYSFGIENTFMETYSGYLQYTGYSNGITGFSLQMGLRGYIEF